MAAYDITAPDGKTYRLDGPAGASKIDLINALAAKYPMAVQTTEELEAAPRAPSSAGNLFKGLSSAVLGGTKSLVDVTGAGTGISKSLGEASQFLESKMTPERQEEMQRRQELIERANRSGSLLKEAKAYLGGVAEAPLESTVRGIGSSAPSIIAGLAALPLEAPAALALGVSAISRIAVGAAQGVGEYKGGVFDTVKAKYMEAGYKEPEAERLAIKAQEYSADKALELGGSALLGALDAYTGVEAAATGAFKKVARPNTPEGLAQAYKGLPKTAPPLASPNILGSAARSVAGEAPIEGLQGGFGQYAQNLAVSKEGFEQAPFEGVLGSSLRDAAVGALVGGTFTPLNHAQRSRDFALDQYLRTQGPIAVAEQERAARRKEIEDANALTKEQLGIKEPPLMLEGPKDKLFKPDEEILRDPVGRITRNELGNALKDDPEAAEQVTSYIDSYRSRNNLPPLQNFSLEDIKDAMTAMAPEGEAGALKSILTYKTGFNNETVSADDVLNAAEAKEIATGTQGFKDFLERATGSSDLDTMSDVQRFSAFKALSSLNKRETGRETVLRPGTNASRFTQDQFDEGLTTLAKYIEQENGKLAMPEAIEIIKAQTSLKTDRDAYTLLNNAAAQNLLNFDKGEVFNVVDRNGDITSTHATEEKAKEFAGKKDTIEKQAGEFVSIAEEPKAKAPLPKGYAVTKQTVEGEVTPAGYQISDAEGKPFPTLVEQVEDLKAKVEQMEGVRRSEADKELTGALRIQQALQQRSDNITKMEALGQTDTIGYKKLKNQQLIAEREFSKRIQSLLDRAERLKAPLKTKPVGRNVQPKDVYTLTKDGKEVGKFKNEDEAYASMFLTPEAEGGLSDAELEDIAVKGGNLGDRAFKAIEARQTKGFKVQTTPEVRAKAEFQAKADEIAKKLLPMLKRFGLEDVGLNIVSAIENGAQGAYLNKLIEVAIGAGKQVETLRHEALHALKDLGFFTDAQWKALERQADKEWINKYLKGVQTTVDGIVMSRHDAYIYLNKTKPEEYNKANPDKIQENVMSPKQLLELLREEAIAEAFADFSINKPPAGMIASLLARLNNFFTALRNALNGAGFNTADDIFEKIEAGELKSTKKGTATAPKYNLRDYKMELEKEERVVGKAASLSDQEIEGLTKDAEQAGLTPKEYKAYAKEAKRIKKQFPLKDGWAPLELVGLTIEKDEDTGAVKTDLKWKAIPYAFNRPYGFDKAPQKIDKVWGDKVADEMFKLVDDIYQRAAKGDKNAQIIIGHQTWYRNVADILRREYGAQGDLLADLLGATSPNTPVNTNWKFSIDILRRFMKGEFDADLRKFDQYVAEGKPIFKYPAADKIRQVTGMLYGMNSTNAMKALLDMWRVIEAGTAPKARNFALNLIGQSNMATIDVWAARMLRRATNMIRGMDLPRIPPPAEKGVTGKWNATATSVTGEFGFGDYVMQEVSKRLNSKGYNVTAPDLQAIAWFAEKELWGKKKWTTVTGEGGSFEENIEAFPVERYLAGWSIQQGGKVPEKEDVSMAQAEVMSMLAGDDSVVSARVMPTLGLYGDTIENSFDTEWTVEKDKHDPSMVMATIAKISERENQYDIFVSKVLSPKEESLNARPGVEIYFKNNKALKDAMPVLEAFTTKGQDGFTMAVDPRSRVNDNYIGVRLQYVPEISMRWDEDLRKNLQDLKFLVNELKTKADALADIAAQVSTMDGVAYSALQNYDTVVVGKENYDEYIDRAASAPDRTTRSETWFGTPIRQAIKRAASRLNGEPRENVARGVSTPSSTETKYSLGTYFPTAKAAEDAAYAKGPPQTREFKVFFGASKAMEEGRAQPMFHASTEEFDIFRENKPIFVSPEARFAEDFIKRRIEEAKSLEYLSEGKERVARIYPLWVRAETPFDYENADHVRMVMEYLYPKLPTEGTSIEKEVKDGLWSRIEEPKFQAALKALGFDSFQIKEDNIKQLAVFKANQVKSITGNTGEFNPENRSIKYSLREFKDSDIEGKKQTYTLPANTLLFHGAYKERADKINEAGKVLLSYAPLKTSSGAVYEGGLIFFGSRDTATRFANNEADMMSVQGARDEGIERLNGTVFETATDKPYRLMSLNYKLSEKEAEDLTKALGLPDYKPVKKGDSAWQAAYRANDYGRSNVKRYMVSKGKSQQEMSSPWPVIFDTLGFDGYFDNQNVPAVVLTANTGIQLVGEDGKLKKYSLPTISAAAQKRVNEATTVTEPKTRFESITEAVFPRSFSYFRQEAINRYNQLSVYDKTLADQMGGKDLLASVSAEQGALFSDLDSGVLASVMGVGNRQGGVPVYRNGITTVDTSVKGLTEVFAPLAKYRDPVVFQHYQFWAAVKRGLRLIEIDKERNIQTSDKIIADELEAKYPEFVQVQKDWITFNNGVVKYLVDTNVLSQERANEYMRYADYIPFYRQLDGRETLGPKVFQSLTTVKPPREIHGSDNPLADFLETVVRNTHASIRAGMKNSAALKAVDVATQVKAAGMGAEMVVDAKGEPMESNSPDTFTVFKAGKKVSYRTPDALLISALTSLNMPELPFMGLISAPANALRNLVTKDPGFMMVNLMRDSLSAYVTSGVNILPIAGSAHQFVKGLMKQSPTMEALLNAGIGGGYEFSQNIERSGANLYADLQKKAGNAPKGLIGLATGVWDALETGTTASDMATRALIYERVMKETGDEAEALKRALEVMNFNRKGRSAVVRILTAAVPFLNARIQGLDVFFRAGVSPTYRSLRGLPVTDQEKAVMRRFWIRGSTMMALSVMYYFAVSDDDEYKKQEQETKDNYWIVPSTKIKIATPFEVGTLFKTIPERIAAYLSGKDTGEDFAKAMYRAFNNTIPISPTAYIPQVFKPLLEYSTNFNFFTMRPIVGQGMEGIDAKYQVGPSTSLTFQELGKTLGVSPLKAEQMYKGYTGTMGMYLVDLMDAVMEASGSNPQATKRFEQLPIIKRFALDPQARGDVTAYYELRNSVHTAVATANMLERSDPKEFIEYFKENRGLLANKDYVNDLYKTLKQFNDMRRMVNTSPMSGDEKRAALTNINFAEQNLTKNIQVVKKAIASTQ